jgi:hypothetical protein
MSGSWDRRECNMSVYLAWRECNMSGSLDRGECNVSG